MVPFFIFIANKFHQFIYNAWMDFWKCNISIVLEIGMHIPYIFVQYVLWRGPF